jgi:hypothetical protein
LGRKQNFTFDPSEATFVFNGIDRVDPNFGYTIQQCVSCCKICNTGKMNLSYREWQAHLDQLAKYQKKREVIS